MADKYQQFKEKAFYALRSLARECPAFEDAEMLVGGAESQASLSKQDVYKSIDTEWVDAIENALPALDIIVRNPTIAIEDTDEILPVELSRHITDKSIKHLAQHTNLILSVKKDGEVVPQKILNVYHDETLLTYENKFINTLLARLSAFVDKRYRALSGSAGIERTHKFNYQTQFEHTLSDEAGKNTARIQLNIELTSPLDSVSQKDAELQEKYTQTLERIKRINMALISYRSSAFSQALGRNYIRPPVVRTNAILKNKNFKECLTLWEYIESFDKVGYSVHADVEMEMPSSGYVGELYSSVALQYTHFYYSIVSENDVRMLSNKKLFDVDPDFATEFDEEEIEDYQVYDSEYKKTVPVSRLMNNRKKLSEDEKRIHRALIVALKADEILNAEMKAAEEEMRRLAKQRRQEEEERLRQEEAERERLAALLAQMPIKVRYRRSFLARYIQANEKLQEYYGRLKNQLLCYKGVKSKISWKADRFSKGRETIAKMDVRGKRLYVYLALDPKAYEGTKYRFTDVSDKKPDTPMLLKIRGKLGILHAAQLVDALAEKFGLTKIERAEENYSMPYEDDQTLIGKNLIKVVFPKGVTVVDGQPLSKENLQDLFANIVKKEKPVPLETPTEETNEQPPESVRVHYRRSFLARYIQASEKQQEYYGRLKNQLLGYKGVKSKISWKADRFNKGRATLVKMDIRGKRLYAYLALDPKAYEGTKYRFTDVSDKKPDTPMLLKIKGKLGILHASELIDALAEKYGLTKIERAEENYSMPYEDDQALIDRSLIKLVYPKGVAPTEGQTVTKADLREWFGNMLRKLETPAQEVSAEETPEEQPTTESEEGAEAVLETPAQEIPAEETPEEVSTDEETSAIEVVPEKVEVHYRHSFLARYIQSGELLQGYYGLIKNKLLRYKDVKSRISFKGDKFNKGRQTLARIDTRGTRLYLYLALDPKSYEGGKYRFTDATNKYEDTPLLLKIKGKLGILHAEELIDEMAEAFGLTVFERADEDYSMPYEDNESLIRRGLIKTIYPTGYVPAENQILVPENVADMFVVEAVASVEALPAESIAEGMPIEESLDGQSTEADDEVAISSPTETPAAEATEADGEVAISSPEETHVAEATEADDEVAISSPEETPAAEATEAVEKAEENAEEQLEPFEYEIEFEDNAQGWYEYILSTAEEYPAFKRQGREFTYGGRTVFRLIKKWRRVYLYLALTTEDFDGDGYFVCTAKKYADTPMLLKIKGERELQTAVALLELLHDKLKERE